MGRKQPRSAERLSRGHNIDRDMGFPAIAALDQRARFRLDKTMRLFACSKDHLAAFESHERSGLCQKFDVTRSHSAEKRMSDDARAQVFIFRFHGGLFPNEPEVC